MANVCEEEKPGRVVDREVKGSPSTERVALRYNELLSKEAYVDSERARLYTEYIREHWNEPAYLRAGGALKHVLSNLTPVIWEDELLVGSQSRYFLGTQVYPEYETWMLEGFRHIKRAEEAYMEGTLQKKEGDRLGIYRIHPEDSEQILEDCAFWEGRDWRSQATRAMEDVMPDYDRIELMQQQLVFPRFMYDVPEGRVIVDYQKVLDLGLNGLIRICEGHLAEIGEPMDAGEYDRYNFYKGTIAALEGVIAFAGNYAAEADRQADGCADPRRAAELRQIAAVCRKVPAEPAETFREAIQSFWFAHLCLFIEINGRGMSPGRFDQYMYRCYRSSIDAGEITDAEVLEYLELLRIKCTELTRAHATFTESFLGGSIYQNMTLGGCDRYGRPCDNEVSRLVLQAGINVRTWQPTLSVRWRDDMSPEFKHAVVDCIKAGSGYPALFSDRVGTARMLERTTNSIEDARDWAPCGCVDMQICGKRMPMYAANPSSNLKMFELAINDGVNPVTGDRLVDADGFRLEDATFDEIVDKYRRTEHYIAACEERCENIIMEVHNSLGLVQPYMSALIDDCLEEGRHAVEGGARYNDSPYIISGGVINVANSLAALKKVVFDDGRYTMAEVKAAVDANFEGHDDIRKALLDAPKFGNDDDYVDDIAALLYDDWADSANSGLNWVGEPWQPSTLSVTTQVLLGKACGATPDGRLAGESTADGAISAHPGTDVNGPTALIRSACKVHDMNLQSTLFNIKFSPSAIAGEAGAEKFIDLNDAYFDLGGYQVQYNIVDKSMLVDAKAHPENYSDLMVRVAGFTARFIDLGPDIQQQIIDRTEYETV